MSVNTDRFEDVNDDDEFEIDIEDDTPEPDRGRGRAPDEDVDDDSEPDDEELKQYSTGAAKRIRVLTKKRHDERRRADAKERELQAAAGTIDKLRKQLSGVAQHAVGITKDKLVADLDKVKKDLAAAVETGDGDKVAELSEKITEIKSNLTGAQRTEQELKVDQPQQGGGDDANDMSKWPKERKRWAKENSDWFHKDRKMTAMAYAIHQELIEDEDFVPDTQEYFDELDARMKDQFPNKFKGKDRDDDEDEDEDEVPTPRRSQSRAAPLNGNKGNGTSNGGGKKKVYKLTRSQADLCKRLGISQKQYVEEMIAKERG